MPYCHVEKGVLQAAKEVICAAPRTQGIWRLQQETDKIAQRHGQQFIDMGQDRFVFRDLHAETQVVAFGFERYTPEDARILFNLHRIFVTIFPHNFPRIHTVWHGGSQSNAWCSFALATEIKDKNNGDLLHELDQKSTYPFQVVIDFIDDLGLPVLNPDESWFNFALGSDGGVYFLDTLDLVIENGMVNWPLEQTLAYMKLNHFKDQNIHAVKSCIKRLAKTDKI